MTAIDPCDWCEEVLQPYLDRELTDTEQKEAEAHLAKCKFCRKRYHFEEGLRRLVHQAVLEPMAPALKQRLSELRLEL
jgi:predicted anti-sigma-YlaC factor YlaD